MYPNEYIIRFYDGLQLMREITVEALNSREALEIAMKETKGVIYYNKIKIKNLGGISYQ